MKPLLTHLFVFIWFISLNTGYSQIAITANAGADLTICENTSATLSASGGNSYSWSSIPFGFSSASSNPIVAPTITTTYIVTAYQAGLSATDDVIVTVLPAPNAYAGEDETACGGGHFSLLAKGGNHYEWSDGKNGAGNPVYWDTPGGRTYTVTVTDNNGCSSTDAVTITVYEIPPVNAGPDVSYCPGSSATITVTGASTYIWNTTSTSSSLSVSPSMETTYTVTGTANGCTASDEVVVNRFPVLTTAITAIPSPICNIQSTDLTASNGISWLWSSGETSAKITVNPLINTNYSVTTTDGNGCTATATIGISANPNITVNASPPIICNGESAVLMCSGANNYIWSQGSTTQNITVSPTFTTTYFVTATAASCSQVSNVVVIVNPLPLITITPPTSICKGSSIALNAVGATSYLWNTSQTASSISVSPNINTTYSVVGTDANGCIGSSQTTITVNPLPIVTANNPTICAGSIAGLTASGAANYQWSGGIGNGPSKAVSPAMTSVYIVTGTDANGCTSTAMATVTVNPLPIVFGSRDKICVGKSTVITASGASNYLWSNGLGTGNNFTTSPTSSITYTVTGTDENTCTSSAMATVIVYPLPILAVNSPTICYGSSAILTVSGALTYNWSGGLGSSAIVSVSPSTTTIYGVTGTDNNFCSASAISKVTVPADITIISSATNISCKGGNNGSIALAVGGGIAPYQYIWNTAPAQTGSTANGLGAGIYTVTVTDANNCTKTATITLTEPPALVATIAATTNVLCYGQNTGMASVMVSGGSPSYSYAWNISPAATTSTISSLIAGNYTVTVSDAKNCTAVAIASISQPSSALDASISSTTDVQCYGQANGEATVMAYYGTPGYAYTWNTVPTQNTATAKNLSAGSYTVTVTDTYGCTKTTAVIISEPTKLIVTSSKDTAICIGESLNLNASGAASYQWFSGGALINPNSASPQTTTTYTVIGTNSDGCTAIDQMKVTVHALPNANAGADLTICYQSTANLMGAGGISYMWSNGVMTPANPVVLTSDQEFTVTVTDANSCENTDKVKVTVANYLTVNITPGLSKVCEKGSTTLTVDISGNYQWNTGPSTPSLGFSKSITVFPQTNTLYYVTAIDAMGCSGTNNILVEVQPKLVLTLSPYEICYGQNSVISAGSNPLESYKWSNGETSASIKVSPPSSTVYSVTVASDACTASATTMLMVNALPALDAGMDEIICNGIPANLYAEGTGNFKWSNAITTASNPVRIGLSTQYKVTLTDSKGCINSDSVFVYVNQLPEIDAGDDQTVCFGHSARLSAKGGESYVWSNGLKAAQIEVLSSNTTTYTVTATDKNTCTNTDNIVVYVLPLPNANAGANRTICAGASIALSGTGGTSCAWSPAGTLSNPRSYSSYAHPEITTTYIITVSEAGCTATDDMVIEVIPIPPANAGSPQTICDGDSARLNASGGAIYTWAKSSALSDLNINNPYAFPHSTTTFTVTVSEKGCFGTDNVTISIIPMPKATISTSDNEICIGEKVILSAHGGTTYQWATSSAASIIVQPTQSQTYTVTAYNSFCSNTEHIFIKVNPLPVPFFTLDDVAGCSPLTVHLHDYTLGAAEWSWYFENNNLQAANSKDPTLIFTKAGKYPVRLVVKDSNGCTNSSTINNMIEVYKKPTADFFSMPEVATFTNSELTFYPEESSAYAESYYWYFEDENSEENYSNLKNPTHTYSKLGVYPVTLIVETKYGCRDTVQKTIPFKDYTFYIPNAFTPDGDGINDYFGPKSIGLELGVFEMYIFDRWGQQVFHTNNIEVLWDGRVQGKTGEPVIGVYTWLILEKMENGKLKKHVGSVTIVK